MHRNEFFIFVYFPHPIFDIRFNLRYDEEELEIIINIEAQKSTDHNALGYHLENRIVFYLARLISSQKETQFHHSEYDDIKKVYSIWICMDAEKDEEGIEHGEALLGTLITKLFEENRNSDIELAAKDENARKKFYIEFGLLQEET